LLLGRTRARDHCSASPHGEYHREKKMNQYNSAATPTFTAEQQNLARIDLRMGGLRVNSPQSPELVRMQAARDDVLSRMSAEEIAAYERVRTMAKSKEQLAAEAEAERIAMDANKDKPAI
jgi:hypothetical protein